MRWEGSWLSSHPCTAALRQRRRRRQGLSTRGLAGWLAGCPSSLLLNPRAVRLQNCLSPRTSIATDRGSNTKHWHPPCSGSVWGLTYRGRQSILAGSSIPWDYLARRIPNRGRCCPSSSSQGVLVGLVEWFLRTTPHHRPANGQPHLAGSIVIAIPPNLPRPAPSADPNGVSSLRHLPWRRRLVGR